MYPRSKFFRGQASSPEPHRGESTCRQRGAYQLNGCESAGKYHALLLSLVAVLPQWGVAGALAVRARCHPGGDTRLSEARAGMLARAKLTVLAVDEYAAFEQYALARCTKSQSGGLTEEEDALYTWLVEQWNLRDHLMGVAQVGSYLPDEDLYRSHSCEERWWESLFSSFPRG